MVNNQIYFGGIFMSRKSNYTTEEKIKVVEDYLNGMRSMNQICHDLGITAHQPGSIRRWISKYKKFGRDGLESKCKNASYTTEFKLKVVEEYISGQASSIDLRDKYNIPGETLILQWTKMYNNHIELKNYDPKPEVYMAEARRKTTIEERKEIVEYCIAQKRDYKGTAEKYDVSYSQVYTWVRKFDTDGEEGLTDKRGRHKSDEEVDELEKLRRENTRLKSKLEERDMTVELLKKMKEFERRRF